jgi:hypothetical protein
VPFFSRSGHEPLRAAEQLSAPFQIMPRRDLGNASWNALADDSDEAWLWHRDEFQDTLATWRGSTDESFAVAAENADQPLALVPLRRISRRKAGVFQVNILESFGGPALQNDLSAKQRRAVLSAVCGELEARARDGRCLEIRLSLPVMAPALRGERCPRVNPLVEVGCVNALTQSWVVDLRDGRDAVWERMEGRARTAVRKAEKSGVTVREAGAADRGLYYRLHRETYSRTGTPPHAEAYFAAIWDKFLGHGLARIWVAEIDGEPVAAENFGVCKQAAIYWTGASSAKGLETEANSLLQWTAMQWMIESGVQWYETGEAFPQSRGGKTKGLNDFKKSFGGGLYPFYKGRLPIGTLWERVYRCARSLSS